MDRCRRGGVSGGGLPYGSTLNLRTHTAMVDIPFTASTYSIVYKSSVNLDQQGATIHQNYNGWVQNLDQAIRRQLSI
jgi:hypothetical protein